MAFVSQSQRIIHPQPKQIWKLIGPGEYDSDHSKINANNYIKTSTFQAAPFNSSTIKKTFFNQIKSKTMIPGPGSYKIQDQMFKPSLKAYSNQKCLIIKLNSLGSSQFLSQVQRFKNSKQCQNPGPGDYEVGQSSFINKNIIKNSKNVQKDSKKIKEKLKTVMNQIKSKPSIPSKYQNPFLSSKQKKVKTQADQPNFYQIQEQQKQKQKNKKKIKAYSWSKSKRNTLQLSKTLPIGPGNYQISKSKLIIPKNKKIKSYSSNFRSQTLRMFDTMIYQSNRKILVQQRSQRQFKSNKPGPGTYQINHSSLKNINQQCVYQFFGSTVERFKTQPKNQNTKLTYINDQEQYKKRIRSFNHSKRPFLSQQPRDMKFLTLNQQIPGPGAYNYHENCKKSKMGKVIQNFGSSIKRFDEKMQVQDPAYEVQLQLQTKISEAKQRLSKLKTQSSIFKSKTKRDAFSNQQHLDLFGSYDTSYYDLNSQMKKKSQYLQNLKKINVEKPAFDIKVPRFNYRQQKKEKTSAEKNTLKFISKSNKDKGYSQNKLVQNIYQNGKNQVQSKKKSVIFNQNQRFQHSRNQGPGVGQYSIRSNWHKKSHNIKFKTQV